MKSTKSSRRKFIQFLGTTALATSVFGIACTKKRKISIETETSEDNIKLPFQPLEPSNLDQVELIKGLEYSILISWKDKISKHLEFGCHCDFTAFLPIKNDEGLLWVNHEYVDPLLVHGNKNPETKTKEQIDQEMKMVGGSLIKIKKQPNGKWKYIANDKLNNRISANTKIKFAWHVPIMNSKYAIGTLGNCSGGVTPWGTILSCEENYDEFYGEYTFTDKERSKLSLAKFYTGWHRFYKYPPEHYGWVVEYNPKNKTSKKLVAMGRFRHECAAIRTANDGRLVVYSGEDKYDECLYKFISKKKDSLEEGDLFVANFNQRKWLHLDWNSNEILKSNFKNQTEVLTYANHAAKLIGGTPLDRPEDIEIDPKTGAVIISLTYNAPKNNFYGSILKLSENQSDPLSLDFDFDTFLTGGPGSVFTCPDNLCFDPKGNLWMCSDIPGAEMNKNPNYLNYKNNSLFYIPMTGPAAGKPLRVANAPVNAEFTGPSFSPDGRTLFLSVQHPGEQSLTLDHLLSHWPEGGDSLPKSSVICISGKTLDKLVGYVV